MTGINPRIGDAKVFAAKIGGSYIDYARILDGSSGTAGGQKQTNLQNEAEAPVFMSARALHEAHHTEAEPGLHRSAGDQDRLGQSGHGGSVAALFLFARTMTLYVAGAVEVLAKPGTAYSIGDLGPDLMQAIRAASHAKVERRAAATLATPNQRPLARTTDRILCFGTSTGGVEALREVLPALPPDAPGILVVQHMPAKFTSSLANSLDKICSLRVR